MPQKLRPNIWQRLPWEPSPTRCQMTSMIFRASFEVLRVSVPSAKDSHSRTGKQLRKLRSSSRPLLKEYCIIRIGVDFVDISFETFVSRKRSFPSPPSRTLSSRSPRRHAVQGMVDMDQKKSDRYWPFGYGKEKFEGRSITSTRLLSTSSTKTPLFLSRNTSSR